MKTFKRMFAFCILCSTLSCGFANQKMLTKKNTGTISCFSGGKLVLKMKSKDKVLSLKERLYRFENDEGFLIETNLSCAIVYDNKEVYVEN